MEDYNCIEFIQLLELASRKAKRLADIATQIDHAVTGTPPCRERIEAKLTLGYLQMCPLKVAAEYIDFPHGRALVFEFYYDAVAAFKMFG
ncbi:MAG: hypothetical protein PHO67_07885 [Candidatus Omnitrophica bacterium]|nr:hypothetical protein [Candidatus Omnitrophota bacterium]